MHLQLTQYKKTVIKLKACGTVVATRKWGLELSVESSTNTLPAFLALEIVLLVKTVEGSLWDSSYGRWGLELCTNPSMNTQPTSLVPQVLLLDEAMEGSLQDSN